MAEVISLLSSPLASPAKPTPPRPRSTFSLLRTIHFESDEFDITGDLNFRIEQPLKKPKTRDPTVRPDEDDLPGQPRKAADALDLSSDFDLPVLRSPGRRTRSNARSLPLHAEEIDDIVFTSSAPARSTNKVQNQAPAQEIFDLSSDSLPDDPFEGLLVASQPISGFERRSVFTEKTANVLANLGQETSKPTKSKPKHRLKEIEDYDAVSVNLSKRIFRINKQGIDSIVVSSSPKAASRQGRSTQTDDDTKQSVAEAKRAQKAAEKEVEKLRKQEEKAQKAREKQRAADLAEVNKSKTNKKDAIAEIMVEMSGNVQGTSVGNQVEENLKQADVSVSYFEEQVSLTDDSLRYQDLGALVRWKRKVDAVYDEEAGQWLPASKTRIKPERHVLVYLKAIDFAMIAAGHSGQNARALPPEITMKENVNRHVATLQSHQTDCIPIYLIEGMYSWLKKNQTARNREYTAAVRAQQALEEGAEGPAGSVSSSQANARKRKKLSEVDLSFITEDVVEDLLLHLQLAHQPVFIQHTTSASTTAAQIVSFTQQLSTRPYRQIELNQNLKTASFCMASGQVRTGDNAQDTYVKMLQEVQRVTPAMAYAIAAEYPSVRELIEGFRQEGNLILEDVRKSANKDGAWTDRRLGPMVSKRLYKVFMGQDPAAMDGMS